MTENGEEKSLTNTTATSTPKKKEVPSINPIPQTYVVPPPPRDLLVGPQIHVALSIVILALSAISLFTPWYKAEQYKSSLFGGQDMTSSVTLWKTTTKISGVSDLTTSVSNYCWPVMRRVRVMEAFACATTAAALVSLVMSVFNYHRRGSHELTRQICSGLAIVTFLLGTIACSFNFSVYYWSFKDCGEGSSFHSKLYEPSVGFGFMVTAWVLTFFTGLVVANNPTIPLDARTIDSAIFLFTLLSLLGLVFSGTSAAVPHWFYKNGDTEKTTDVFLWKTQQGRFDWHLLEPSVKETTWPSEYRCDTLATLFYAAEGLALAAAVATAVTLVWGVLLWQSLIKMVLPGVFLSVASAAITFSLFVLETVIYRSRWCGDAYAYSTHKFILGPGYALLVTSLWIMVLASLSILVAHIGITKYYPSKLTRIPILGKAKAK